ncbi:MAG: cysteine methyltransferase [Marinilabiliales bacterium]|nr:MAG: cysteine methyltransferase [Marinilabiliales bacterium]
MDKNFFDKVYEVAEQIPYGRVCSYGAIANYLGSRGSARMVGWAMNSSKTSSKNIPAHRVVNSKGLLTGKQHFGGNNTMAELLISEGIKIHNDKIEDFENVLWDPSVELKEY